MKLLLNNDSIDIDLPTYNYTGYTPLCVAAISGNYEILKMLIYNGAEVNKPNKLN
jgi:ankyrin repeat protein